jgi:hypothetical protein
VVDFTPDGSAATTSAGTGIEPTSAAVVENSSAVKGTATGSSAKVTATPVTGGAIGTGTTTSSGSTATSSHNAAAGKTKPGMLVAALGMAAALL